MKERLSLLCPMCTSYHVIPTSQEEHDALKCRAKFEYRCTACGRPEGMCSADPCVSVIRDREATMPTVQGMHAHDRLIQKGQKTVTTICGQRVAVGRSVIITTKEHRYPASERKYTCVGCVAVVLERAKDAQQQALDTVKYTQRQFWEALRNLEATGITEQAMDGIEDWQSYDLETLHALGEGGEVEQDRLAELAHAGTVPEL